MLPSTLSSNPSSMRISSGPSVTVRVPPPHNTIVITLSFSSGTTEVGRIDRMNLFRTLPLLPTASHATIDFSSPSSLQRTLTIAIEDALLAAGTYWWCDAFLGEIWSTASLNTKSLEEIHNIATSIPSEILPTELAPMWRPQSFDSLSFDSTEKGSNPGELGTDFEGFHPSFGSFLKSNPYTSTSLSNCTSTSCTPRGQVRHPSLGSLSTSSTSSMDHTSSFRGIPPAHLSTQSSQQHNHLHPFSLGGAIGGNGMLSSEIFQPMNTPCIGMNASGVNPVTISNQLTATFTASPLTSPPHEDCLLSLLSPQTRREITLSVPLSTTLTPDLIAAALFTNTYDQYIDTLLAHAEHIQEPIYRCSNPDCATCMYPSLALADALTCALGIRVFTLGVVSLGCVLADSRIQLMVDCVEPETQYWLCNRIAAVIRDARRTRLTTSCGAELSQGIGNLRVSSKQPEPTSSNSTDSKSLSDDLFPLFSKSVDTTSSSVTTNKQTPTTNPPVQPSTEGISRITFTLGQVGVILTLTNAEHDALLLSLIEHLNLRIGRSDLFRRSLTLIRCWWTREPLTYIGSNTMRYLNDSALTVVVAMIFNCYSAAIDSPFSALILFLARMSTLQPETDVVTIEGVFRRPSSASSANSTDDEDGLTRGSNIPLPGARMDLFLRERDYQPFWNRLGMSSEKLHAAYTTSLSPTSVETPTATAVQSDSTIESPTPSQSDSTKDTPKTPTSSSARMPGFAVLSPLTGHILVDPLSTNQLQRLRKTFESSAASMSRILKQLRSTNSMGTYNDIQNDPPKGGSTVDLVNQHKLHGFVPTNNSDDGSYHHALPSTYGNSHHFSGYPHLSPPSPVQSSGHLLDRFFVHYEKNRIAYFNSRQQSYLSNQKTMMIRAICQNSLHLFVAQLSLWRSGTYDLNTLKTIVHDSLRCVSPSCAYTPYPNLLVSNSVSNAFLGGDAGGYHNGGPMHHHTQTVININQLAADISSRIVSSIRTQILSNLIAHIAQILYPASATNGLIMYDTPPSNRAAQSPVMIGNPSVSHSVHHRQGNNAPIGSFTTVNMAFQSPHHPPHLVHPSSHHTQGSSHISLGHGNTIRSNPPRDFNNGRVRYYS